METNLTVEALKFMILGMGIVFFFLVVMVYALKIQAKIVGKYFPQKKVTSPTPTRATQASNDSKKTAAIVAAVQHHKNLKG